MPSETFGRRLLHELIGFFAVTAVATIGTLPLVMTYFQQVSLIGVLTNCLFVPMVGFIVIPLGLLSVLLSWIWSPLAVWGLQLAGWLLDIAVAGIERFAALPFAAVQTFVPTWFETVCYYLLLAAFLSLIGPMRIAEVGCGQMASHGNVRTDKEKKKRVALFASLRPHSRWMAAAAVLAVAGALIDAGYWIHRRLLHGDLHITVIDVGQGSAALLELPGGSCMLVDGGGFADNAVFDIGQRVLAPLLRRKKILTVDTLVLTHPNSDHLNGLIYIADRFAVKQIWSNGEKRDTLGYRRLQEVLDRRSVRHIAYARLPRKHRIAGYIFCTRRQISWRKARRSPGEIRTPIRLCSKSGWVRFPFCLPAISPQGLKRRSYLRSAAI